MLCCPLVIDVVSAAGDVGSDAESDIGPAAEEARGEAARDSHVAAITFWGALKIPVSMSVLLQTFSVTVCNHALS